MAGDPFRIDCSPATPLRRAVLAAARPLVSWLFQLEDLRALYRRAQDAATGSFAQRVLDACDIDTSTTCPELNAVPTQGPLIVAANHPHGALDGLVLASLLGRRRPDVRVLANYLLSRVPELRELCLFVDPFGGLRSAARSQSGLRAAHLWLRGGGSLIVFPAGEVAHTPRRGQSYIDSPWRTTVGRLALSTGAQVLPAFIEGSNSPLFYAAAAIHPLLRTALLGRELLGKRGHRVAVRFGRALAARDLESHRDASALTIAVRQAVEDLERGHNAENVRFEAVASIPIVTEVERLPAESCLVESGEFQVFCAEARQIPNSLPEIGRLREVAYRAIGEGTGRERDLDEFDERYLHLFSWDRDRKQIVGGYRIGRTDRILAEHGVRGLYTRTLFTYDARLIDRLSPALELGRSFVRAEYQRHHSALLLLWKGISQFVARHPHYRVLFGPVSISARYSEHSQQLLIAFLQQNHLDHSLAGLVEAVHPATCSTPRSAPVPRSIEEANALVSQAEGDGKGVPVLLRQYLKLNARVIGFNVDPDFGDALDALMAVDLASVPPAMLSRYFGREHALRFLSYHQADPARVAA